MSVMCIVEISEGGLFALQPTAQVFAMAGYSVFRHAGTEAD